MLVYICRAQSVKSNNGIEVYAAWSTTTLVLHVFQVLVRPKILLLRPPLILNKKRFFLATRDSCDFCSLINNGQICFAIDSRPSPI